MNTTDPLAAVSMRRHLPRVLGPEDVAHVLGVPGATARRWLRAGELGPTIRLGRRLFILSETMLDHLAAREECREPELSVVGGAR